MFNAMDGSSSIGIYSKILNKHRWTFVAPEGRWSPSGKKIFVLSEVGVASILDQPSGTVITLDSGKESSRSVERLPDGQYVLIAKTARFSPY